MASFSRWKFLPDAPRIRWRWRLDHARSSRSLPFQWHVAHGLINASETFRQLAMVAFKLLTECSILIVIFKERRKFIDDFVQTFPSIERTVEPVREAMGRTSRLEFKKFAADDAGGTDGGRGVRVERNGGDQCRSPHARARFQA